MMRIAQVLGMALALVLNLASPCAASEDGTALRSSASPSYGEPWLRILSDASLDLSERLELASTDMSINKWFKLAAVESPPLGQRELDKARVIVEASSDPVLAEIFCGLEAMMQGIQALEPAAPQDVESLTQDLNEEFDLTELVTDPSLPSIIGDEWASFLEGLVAALGAASVHQSDPALALKLASTFADRMQRVPRLFALGALSGLFEIRGDWRPYISKEDLRTLQQDRIASDRYVARLAELADHGTVS